jgi:hypothetical protein
VAGVVVEAVVSNPVAPVAAVVVDAVDSAVLDVVKFALTAARLSSMVRLLSYFPSVPNILKLTQVSPSELSLSAMQSSYSASLAQRLMPSLVIFPPPRQTERTVFIIRP